MKLTELEPDRKAMSKLPRGAMFLFLHIPKTAGATVLDILLRHTKPATYHYFGAPASLSYLSDRELNEADVIAGHFGFALTQRISRPHKIITFLRDPFDRIVSLYYYARRVQTADHRPMVWAAKRLSLEEFVASEDPIVQLATRNGQTWQIFYDNTPWFRQTFERMDEADILKKAIENLQSIDFVGLTSKTETSVRLMEHMFGWPQASIPSLNVSSNRPALSAVPKRTRALIEQKMPLDVALYQEAQNIFSRY